MYNNDDGDIFIASTEGDLERLKYLIGVEGMDINKKAKVKRKLLFDLFV